MQSNEIREKFLKFFEKRGHKIIPSASLVPENDPSVLFNTAGMQPLVPYLLGEKHPAGSRIVDVQKCIRTGDIDEVGDNTHLTFFEMLGNWSLGDYFKAEAIKWSWELLTNKEEGFGLNPSRLYVTCFEGDENASRDEESASIWSEFFNSANIDSSKHVFFLPAEKNWWSPGDNGPCGPDTEMYYDVTEAGVQIENLTDFKQADDEQKIVEIWNDVFMEYEKKAGQIIGKLAQKNVDTGSGLERVAIMLQGKNNVYDTDLFAPIISKINELSKNDDLRAKRIVADHIRTAVFMIADGVIPANTDQGYILRRILRRAVRFSDTLGITKGSLIDLSDIVIDKYGTFYEKLVANRNTIKNEISKEENKFRETLEKGLREFEKGRDPFDLYQSYGFPIELTEELAKEKGLPIDRAKFDEEMKKHQELSRQGAEQKFKGGLGGSSDQIVKYHTATHLLQQALIDVLGPEVAQKGSNITEERLRFDFTWPTKMTDEEKQKVEQIVNEKIKASLPVTKIILSKAEAEKTGARHLFSEKYGDEVSIYFIGDNIENAYSKEFCGGPHVENTDALGHFKISKEEAVASGIRRIKAILS